MAFLYSYDGKFTKDNAKSRVINYFDVSTAIFIKLGTLDCPLNAEA